MSAAISLRPRAISQLYTGAVSLRASFRHRVMATSSSAASVDIAVTADKREASAADVACDVLALGVYTDSLTSPQFTQLDSTFGGDLSAAVAEAEFKAKAGSSCVARVRAAGPKRVALVGLGDTKELSPRVWKAAGSAAAQVAKTAKAATMRLGVLAGAQPDELQQQALLLGALLGTHTDERFKSKPKATPLKTIELALPTASSSAVAAAQAVASGAVLTRHIVGAPPNVLTPSALAADATTLATTFPDVLSLRILERDECERRGMGAFLGVAAASDEPLKFIHLTYTPVGGAAAGAPVLALVGKGLTFDSGGYNIKAGPGSMIELMKFDCGGSAAVLGAAKAIAQLRPQGCTVHFIVAACENMISGRGMRPGDILTSAAGKTIEVNNTVRSKDCFHL